MRQGHLEQLSRSCPAQGRPAEEGGGDREGYLFLIHSKALGGITLVYG